jgi:hypothetical protein
MPDQQAVDSEEDKCIDWYSGEPERVHSSNGTSHKAEDE